MRTATRLVLAAAVVGALTACTPGGSGADTTAKTTIDVGTAAQSSESPAVKNCAKVRSALGIFADGLSLDTSRAFYEDARYISCTWTKDGKSVIDLTIGQGVGSIDDLMTTEDPTIINDPLAMQEGGVLRLGKTGDTLAQAGRVAFVTEERGITLSLLDPGATGPVGSATVADVGQTLIEVAKAFPVGK